MSGTRYRHDGNEADDPRDYLRGATGEPRLVPGALERADVRLSREFAAELVRVMDLVEVEWVTDPPSVACFDARTIEAFRDALDLLKARLA